MHHRHINGNNIDMTQLSYPFHAKIIAQNGTSTVAQAHFIGRAHLVYLGDGFSRRAVDGLQRHAWVGWLVYMRGRMIYKCRNAVEGRQCHI